MAKFTRTGIILLLITAFFAMLLWGSKYPIESEINENIMDRTEEIKSIPVIKNTEKAEIWQIEIPKISLIATIAEGTTKEILNQYVGHFENTSKEIGNIGLAAHNRGYSINYFKDLKLLVEGDEIIYRHNMFEKIYEVNKCKIIRDTEWEYLDTTEENMLTLITCVENEPEYRRCVQAIEKEEEIY